MLSSELCAVANTTNTLDVSAEQSFANDVQQIIDSASFGMKATKMMMEPLLIRLSGHRNSF